MQSCSRYFSEKRTNALIIKMAIDENQSLFYDSLEKWSMALANSSTVFSASPC